ncbi:MAG: ferrous iron transport protein B, partial [Oscillospiraceae bacterium]
RILLSINHLKNLFLSILEDSGYMARAAFIMDRLLRKLGLSGKSFIPMLMGFGCTTPAVMCARSLEDEKARKLTIMITPFMSCGARLPIYALFATAFFDAYRGLVVFSMYILGMIIAIISGIFLKATIFKGDSSSFLLELPSYRLPTPKNVILHMWDKAKGFLIKAGTVILAMSIMVWLFQNFNLSFEMVNDSTQSIFGQFGMLIAPIFIPLGFGTWQASVSLLTGLIAKESVVSTMCVLYAAANTQELIPILSRLFTPASALSFMTFSLLYMPCISAFVTIKNEMNSMKWALGTALFQTGVAYFIAIIIYQIASRIL